MKSFRKLEIHQKNNSLEVNSDLLREILEFEKNPILRKNSKTSAKYLTTWKNAFELSKNRFRENSSNFEKQKKD